MGFSIGVTVVLYGIVAAVLVLLSNKASVYVDLLDKKTSLSGAFIGGVMLSAVTSLPEMFTSITSALILDKPGLAMGNILGSNLFNLTLLGVLVALYAKAFSKASISKGHSKVGVLTWLIFGAVALNYTGILDVNLGWIAVTSIIILGLYISGIRFLSQGEEGGDDEQVDDNNLTVKQVVIRFVLVSIGIVVLSIFITYLTDDISVAFNLGSGLAGALFLGIATSLPELASTISLFRMGNFNIALGNIIGSNMFNFMILSATDVLYLGQGIYDFSDPKTVVLLGFGLVATPLYLAIVTWNKQKVCIAAGLGLLACYMGFLMI